MSLAKALSLVGCLCVVSVCVCRVWCVCVCLCVCVCCGTRVCVLCVCCGRCVCVVCVHVLVGVCLGFGWGEQEALRAFQGIGMLKD